MDNAEDFVKFVVQRALDKCDADLSFFNDFYDKTLLDRLNKVVTQPFARVSYREAIELLQTEIAKDKSKWQVTIASDPALPPVGCNKTIAPAPPQFSLPSPSRASV